MTIDKSLKTAAGLVRARGVLTRAERIEKMKEAEKWADGRSPLGLPKVRVFKLNMKKKKKAKAEEGAEGAAPAGGAAKGAKVAATAGKPAAAAAKPAAGAKAAAPAKDAGKKK